MRLCVALLLLLSALPALPALAEPADAYVRVNPRDRRYLELTDGTPYIPVGLNMVGPSDIKAGEYAKAHHGELTLPPFSRSMVIRISVE
jgi:hypothetical protein